MPDSAKFTIDFPGGSAAKKGQLISSLADELYHVEGVGSVEVHKEQQDSQDSGTLISIVLASPAVVAVITAIHKWMVRRNQSSIIIRSKDGDEIYAKNLESSDVAKLSEAIKATLQR